VKFLGFQKFQFLKWQTSRLSGREVIAALSKIGFKASKAKRLSYYTY